MELHQALRDAGRRVLHYWAAHRGIHPRSIIAPWRDKNLIWPRHETMHLMHESTTMTVPQIGLVLGGRNHSTVLYGIRKVRERIAEQLRYREDMENHARVLNQKNDIVDLRAAVAQRKERPVRLTAGVEEIRTACLKHFGVAPEIFAKIQSMGPVGFYPTYHQCFIFVLWLYAKENKKIIATALGTYEEWVHACLVHVKNARLDDRLFKYDILKVLEEVYTNR